MSGDVAVLVVDSRAAKFIPTSTDTDLSLTFLSVNHSSGTVYYGSSPSVSASSNDGSLTPGQTVDRHAPTYLIAATAANNVPASATVTVTRMGLAATKVVCVFDTVSGKYPTRPAEAVSVEWIGPAATDPAVGANVLDGLSGARDNDTWIQT